MSLSLAWDLGGDAVLLASRGDDLTLRSSRAFPPGAPARGVLQGANALPLTLKVAGSRREGDAFVVRGRLVSPTVALRAVIAGRGDGG